MEQELIKYVKLNLLKEVLAVNFSSDDDDYEDKLSYYEKAIIYKYTDDGYESLNEQLRNNQQLPEFGNYLNYSLNKLPNFEGLCYRTIKCSKKDLKKYYQALKSGNIITEKTFLSTSKSKLLALQFSESPLFIIKSKKGKDIEKIAKFGIDSYGQNEKEVLFMSNSKFKVLEIVENDKIIIYLEEV